MSVEESKKRRREEDGADSFDALIFKRLSLKYSSVNKRIPAFKIQVESLLSTDERYLGVLERFSKDLPMGSCEVFGIDHVENCNEYAKYCMESMKMVMTYGKTDFINKNFERFLWHGTSISNLESILENGFDRMTIKTGVYGKGFYFTNKAKIAALDVYAKPAVYDIFHANIKNTEMEYVKMSKNSLKSVVEAEVYPEDVKCVMLCRVLVGKVHKVAPKAYDKSFPIKGFHSTGNIAVQNHKNPFLSLEEENFIVSYQNKYIYPEYLVFFKAKEEWKTFFRTGAITTQTAASTSP